MERSQDLAEIFETVHRDMRDHLGRGRVWSPHDPVGTYLVTGWSVV